MRKVHNESKPIGSRQPGPTNQQPACLFPTSPLNSCHTPDQVGQQRFRELLTRKELADRWACCPHTIARRKDLKPFRFNKRMLRYRLADIEAIEAAARG